LGREPERPSALEGIENLPQTFEVMETDVLKLKAFISANIPD
jgi:threonine synthase